MLFPTAATSRMLLVFVGSLLFWTVGGKAPATNKQTGRNIKILNDSGGKVEVYWVHPTSRETSLMSTPVVFNGASFPLDSFIGHEFEIREVPNAKTGICNTTGDAICHSGHFAVSENDDQVITIKPGAEIEFLDDQIRAAEEAGDLVKACQESAKDHIASATDKDAMVQAMEQLLNCVEQGVAYTLSKANEEIAFHSKIRRDMAAQMENYTCVDPELDTTDAIESKYWRSVRDKQPRQVDVLFERPSSKIHLVHSFISDVECQAMEEAAKSQLHRATVADGKGGSQMSEHRKAMQAGITVSWGKEAAGDPIAALSRRVYDYAEYVLNLGIQEFGQEDLMSIQYFGRGEDDTAPDRYTPHCDGDCTGLEFVSGNRMATMVMYCTVPESGGHTNFRNAGVHVKPERGNAVFFSYIDPETHRMDDGFTEHSGCPVYHGEKKIVTQWIRLGVDTENPWNSFNTLGLKLSENDEL